MAITITKDAQTITLHRNMRWLDQFAWQPVQASAVRMTMGGKPVRDLGVRQAWRPITLAGGWTTYADVATLDGWASIADQQLALDMHGTPYTVVFDHEAGAIAAQPIVDFDRNLSTDYCELTLRLRTVA